MEQVCHRCGTALNESDPFCPHCGAPQLRYEAVEDAAPSANPSPAQRLTARNLNGIAWHDAILAAALIAFPAGVLSSLLGLEALWVLAGGMAVISLYRRRTGTLPTSRIGWRIGALLGLFAAAIAAAVDGITLLLQRYAFHQGAALDHHFREMGQQITDQLVRSNPDAATMLPGFLHFWLTPDGVAAMMLSNAAGLAVTMLLFAAAGGALGARLTQKTAQPSAR
jgi:zinc-ribbon domain